MLFLSLKYVIISLMLIELLKLLTSVNFFFSRCSKSKFCLVVHSGIIYLFFVPFKWYKVKQIFRDINLFLCDKTLKLQVDLMKLL